MTTKLSSLDVIPQWGPEAKAAFIYLHGEDETVGECRTNFLKLLRGQGHQYIRFYFPTPSQRAIRTRETGSVPWISCKKTGSKSDDVKRYIEDAEATTDLLWTLVSQVEKTGIPRERIIIGGFSRGGAAAIYATYVCRLNVGCVVSVSTPFLLFAEGLNILSGVKVPVLSLYGERDSVVDYDTMNLSWRYFRNNGILYEPMAITTAGHHLSVEFSTAIFSWLKKRVPDLDD